MRWSNAPRPAWRPDAGRVDNSCTRVKVISTLAGGAGTSALARLRPVGCWPVPLDRKSLQRPASDVSRVVLMPERRAQTEGSRRTWRRIINRHESEPSTSTNPSPRCSSLTRPRRSPTPTNVARTPVGQRVGDRRGRPPRRSHQMPPGHRGLRRAAEAEMAIGRTRHNARPPAHSRSCSAAGRTKARHVARPRSARARPMQPQPPPEDAVASRSQEGFLHPACGRRAAGTAYARSSPSGHAGEPRPAG